LGIVGLALTGALGACATLSSGPLPELAGWRLSPASLGAPVRAVQQIRAESEGRAWRLQTVLEVSLERLVLVGLSGFDRRVLTVRYDGTEFVEEADSRLPAAFRGARILQDLQLVYGPAAAIAAALPAGFRLEEDAGERRLLRDGVVVVRIRCAGPIRLRGRCEYEAPAGDHRLTIDSRDEEP
jgi:hypothetical protein